MFTFCHVLPMEEGGRMPPLLMTRNMFCCICGINIPSWGKHHIYCVNRLKLKSFGCIRQRYLEKEKI
ncbi:uncharacterized protein LOC121404422 [Drosophila obscura]|uniref:uncharacterized protein LOC121404422 n=1 Tax=Drosophila obscura TaxID=7282 RepID=UPI001BB2C497|nr:uncharacterized protein LOC121404422 [Drosophila obscura]